MHPKNLRIQDFTYQLPADRIAKYPLEERDASKLLIYKTGNIQEDIYRHITAHIPTGSLLVFNQTKVVHARLLFKKETGGIIEIFCLEPHEQYTDVHAAMQQKGKVLWNCMIGGASKWKHGTILTLQHERPDFALTAKITDRNVGNYAVELEWNNDFSFAEILHYAGQVPLPPYLHREVEASDETRYQTIFAKTEGSVAAPTAGLHFTQQVLDSLRQEGIDIAYVTLHVGAGTFKPVKSETMDAHDMHAEWIDIDIQSIQSIITHLDKGIKAVGTTSARTLESLYWIGCKFLQKRPVDLSGIAIHQWDPYELNTHIDAGVALKAVISYMEVHNMMRLVTRTQILIAPGYDFKVIKGLVTNFHQPQSTLLLLIAAFIGDNWRKLYDYALAHDYRFLSYGDGCLLIK
jgi:S-adenosylmethionine:tRNA ribosyltransferase-isomerase